MGPTKIHGLPAHILLVHVVVVLVPTAALLVLVAGVWPAARHRLTWLPAAAALGALASIPVTTHAGKWLRDHFRGDVTPEMRRHIALGNHMLGWVGFLFVAALAVTALAWRESGPRLAVGASRSAPWAAPSRRPSRRPPTRTETWLRVLVAVLAITAATGAVQQTYRTGESGSRAVWTGLTTG